MIDSKKSNLSYFNVRVFFNALGEDMYILIYKIKDIGLKILFYNKMPISAELIEILKENEIRGCFQYTKSKLIDFC